MWSATLLDRWDLAILEFFAAHRTPAVDSVSVALGVTGTDSVALGLLTLAAIVFGLAARGWRQVVAVLAAITVAKVGVGILKDLLQRPRPPLDLALLPGDGYSCPSTHAAFTSAAAAAFVAATLWRSPRRRRLVAALLAAAVALVGVDMVYLGSHWAGDVVVGWALGTPTGYAIGRALRRREPPTPGEARSPRDARQKRAEMPRSAERSQPG